MKLKKITIYFDNDTFAEIKTQAAKENKTLNEMVQVLCKIGLFDLNESDRLEQLQ